MKICGLITVLSISVTPACTLEPLNISLQTTNVSALELPIFTHCNASAFWLPENENAEGMYPDCYAATLEFLGIASQRARAIYEFHAAGVQQRQSLPSQTTPIRYTHSTNLIMIPIPN